MDPYKDDPRIESMYRSDRAWAIIALFALWCTLLFVFSQAIAAAPGMGGITTALAIGGAMVLLLNTAAIVALLRHYVQDKQHLYSLDIHYLDEMKRRG